MDVFLHHLSLAFPLFSLVFIGYAVMRFSGWPTTVSDGLTCFVFNLAIPVMLFRLMSDSAKSTLVDSRLLIVFFGGCLIVFVIGRIVSWKIFRLDGVSQSVFALGCIFSNCIQLGLPLARMSLGDEAIPSVALILVFNALILWTLVTVSVEWAKHGHFSVRGFARTVRGVLTNPVIVAILAGTLFGMTGLALPQAIDIPLGMIAQTSPPLALIALGMGLAEYGIGDSWQLSVSISLIKLLVTPLVVWGLAWLLGIPRMETQVVVLLSSMSVGANVYLMSRHFKVLEGAVASSLAVSTLLAAVTTPVILALMGSAH